MAKSVPEAPARAAEVTKAISLYLVILMPTLSAAMRLSRTAIMALPERLFTKLNTINKVTNTRIKPAANVEIGIFPDTPMGPPIMVLPPSSRFMVSFKRLK